MILLPTTVRNYPVFRILTMPEGTWTSGQVWSPLPVPGIIDRTTTTAPAFTYITGTVAQGGYHVGSISRNTLPDEDIAQFYVDTGTINGVHVTAANLTNTAIRIQVQDDETFPGQATDMPSTGWKTVFLGTVYYQQNEQQPGQSNNGRTTYYCAGTLWRTRLWPLDRHTTANMKHAKGHPGYNLPLHGWFRKVLGNKSATVAPDPFGDLTGPPDISSYYTEHTLPVDGSGAPDTKWTDAEVVAHALASSRANGEPLIQVDLSNGLFDGCYAWNISPGDTCWDLIRRICNRQRGRGSVFLDYTDTDDNLGPVYVTLRARASNINPIVWQEVQTPGDMDLLQEVSIGPAYAGGSDPDAINVDINGDHRVTEDGLHYDNRLSAVYDGVTVQGECLQVLCNLNFFGVSLGARWSSGDAAAFNTLLATNQIRQRTSARFRHVYRRYGIPNAWNYQVKAEQSSDAARSILYYTDRAGTISHGTLGTTLGMTSEVTTRVLPDLPIYEGWDYSAVPSVRFDGLNDYLPPARMDPVIMYNADHATDGGALTWVPLQLAGWNIQTDDFGMYIVNGLEDQNGLRLLAPSTDSSPAFADFSNLYNIPDVTVSSGININKLNTIVGVELGTRVSLYKTGPAVPSYETSGRRLTMTISGLHLWLGSPGAIWLLDYINAAGSNNKWQAAMKLPTDKIAVVIRDDRDMLSFISALAWEYYGYVHNPAYWSLKDCGLLTQFAVQGGSSISYPKLGQLVGSITYSGGAGLDGIQATINTPITCIHYDHERGETTWRTDYIEYDGNLQ